MKMQSEDLVGSVPTNCTVTWIGCDPTYGPHIQVREDNGPVHRIWPETRGEYLDLLDTFEK